MSYRGVFDSSNSLEEKCLHLANKLILHCRKPCPRVQCIREINSDLIVFFFENITNHSIPDLLLCTNKEEEAHNVQAVIDTLSLDLLGISLSHITGEDVVAGNLVALSNLLEVLEAMAFHLEVKRERNGSSRSGSLKRKICRRKKSIPPRKSKSPHHSSVGHSVTKDANSEETSKSTSGSFTFPIDSKLLTPSPESGSKKPTDISVKSHFTLEKNLTSEYPASSSTASYSPPSKVTEGEKSEAVFQEKPLEGETDDITYPKQVVSQVDNYASTKPENKPHFRTEKIEQDKPSMTFKEIPSTSVHFKRKISKLPHEKKIQHSGKKEQEVEELFEKNLEQKVKVLLEKNSSYYPRASRLKRLQIQNLQKPSSKTTFTPCRKSFLLPHSLRRRSIKKTSSKRTSGRKNLIHQTHSTQAENSKGFIEDLFEEFPGLQLPAQIANHIRRKYQRHLLKLHKQVKSCLLRKPKSQLQAEEASKRQALLSELLKKSIYEEQFLLRYYFTFVLSYPTITNFQRTNPERESRENRKYEKKIKYRLRDARLQSAKMKQYCDEFHTEMKKKMQKRNFTEELILEKVFLDALNIQKEQVSYLCEEVKEAEENDAKQHLAYLDALENLYQTQFAMLSEAISDEKEDKREQVKAQEQVMRFTQRDFQEELKKEIRLMQKVILECTEETHFREMDAELHKEKLKRRYL